MEGEDRQQKERPELHVDEEWKRAVAEEKERLREQEKAQSAQAGRRQLPQPTMEVFLAGLYTQTLIALGEVENPLTHTKQADPAEAAYLIDTIAMLQEKTRGNLTEQEGAYLQGILTDLRMRYVRLTAGGGRQDDERSQET